MHARYFAAAAAAAALAAACASAPTPYAPATGASSYGYSEQKIEADRYAIRFNGNRATAANAAQDYALLRAAEITLRDGYEWFAVVDRAAPDQSTRSSNPNVSVGVGGTSGSFGSGVSTGVGISFGGGGARTVREPAALEVKMGSGPRPDQANVYDAQSVVDTLGRRVALGG